MISFNKSFDMPIAIVRPFNTYGPRQSARAIIPTIISQILQKKDKLLLGSLSPTRDFTYVDDTVEGFISQLSSSKGIGETINIGTGFEISIRDLAVLIKDELNSEIYIEEENNRLRPKNSEVERLLASNEKAKKLLNWTPNYHGLDGLRNGLKKTIKWFSDEKNLLLYKSDRYNY